MAIRIYVLEATKEEYWHKVDLPVFFAPWENITLAARALSTQRLDKWSFGMSSFVTGESTSL
jgi:hypothetical protein